MNIPPVFPAEKAPARAEAVEVFVASPGQWVKRGCGRRGCRETRSRLAWRHGQGLHAGCSAVPDALPMDGASARADLSPQLRAGKPGKTP